MDAFQAIKEEGQSEVTRISQCQEQNSKKSLKLGVLRLQHSMFNHGISLLLRTARKEKSFARASTQSP